MNNTLLFQDTRITAPTQDAVIVILCGEFLFVKELGARQAWTIGRSDGLSVPDIHVDSRVVRRGIQGHFRYVNGVWSYYDESTVKNATYLNGIRMDAGERGEKPLSNGDILRIDLPSNPHPEGVWILFSTVRILGTWKHFDLSSRAAVSIGRDAACDICEPMAYISARHAVIQRRGGQLYLSDNHSKAGVWRNGKRIVHDEPLSEKDWFSICDCHFILVNNRLVYNQRSPDDQSDGQVLLRADIHSKTVKDRTVPGGQKELLHDIQVEVKAGTLVALLGVSGAGKSTLMDCLNGMNRADVNGTVLYRGENLYENFPRLKRAIGSVPQKNTFRDAQTVEEELRYDATLRLPGDTRRREIQQKVDEVANMLGFRDEQRRNMIRKLSGGEQKRVSIGVELVADRELLCLDEPDAGLDPLTKRELFRTLRDLAHKQDNSSQTQGKPAPKTILVIIHDVAEIPKFFDQVILLLKEEYGEPIRRSSLGKPVKEERRSRGRLAFSGTPQEALEYFRKKSQSDPVFQRKKSESKGQRSVDSMADAYELVKDNPGHYIWNPNPQAAVPAAPSRRTGNPYRESKALSLPKEFLLSVRQFFGILLSDKRNLLISLLFPLAAALITVLVAGENMFIHYEGTKSACFLLVSAAIWVGLFNSIQIVVRERDVVKLEYAAGRRLTCYVLSKALVQMLLCLAESGLLVSAYWGIRVKFDNPMPEAGIFFGSTVTEYFVSLFLLMFAADTMGMFISCLVKKVETANMLSPYILILQLVFSGVLFNLNGLSDKLSYAMLSRWGMEALGSTSDMNHWKLRLQLDFPTIPNREAEEMFLRTAGHLRTVWLILILFSAFFLVLGILSLRRVAKDSR